MRYVNPKDYGYVSQFIEAPLDYMNKALQSKQESFDKQQLELSEAQKEANLKGGYQTQQLARETAEAYKAKIEKLSKNLTENGSLPGSINAITSLRNEFNNNPDVQTIRYDEQARALAEKQHLDPTFAESVQNYYDPKAGYVQRKSGETFSPEWYKLYKPTDFVADHKDFYSYLKDNLRKTGETIGYEYKEDSEGNPIGWFQKNTNQFVRGITPEDVAPIANNYASNPENASSHESAIYLNQKGLKERGVGLSKEDYANELVKNYPGYHSAIENTESEKQLTKGKVASKTSSGNENENDNSITNRLNTIMENTAAAETKASTLTNKDMAGMLNGTLNKDGSIQVNMTDRPTYIKLIKDNIKNEKDVEKNMHLTDFVGLKAEEQNIKKKAEADARAKIGIVFGEAPNDWNPFNEELPRSTKTADGKYYIVNLGQDNIALQDVNTPPGFRPTKRMTKEEFINFETNNGVEVEKRRDVKGNPVGKLAQLEELAKQKGFDLNDKELIKDSQKFIDDPALTNFVVALQGLTGDRQLRPAADKNGFMDDEGNFVTHNNLSISEEEAKNLFGDHWFTRDYKNLEKEGYIKPRVVKSGEGSNAEDVTVYDIPIFNKVTDNVGDLSERVNSANYQAADGSQAEWFNKSIPKLRQSSLDTHAYLKAKLQREKAPSRYENNYKEQNLNFQLDMKDRLKDFVNEQVNQGIDKASAENIRQQIWETVKAINNLPDNTKEQRAAKARQMFDLKLLINDKKTYNKIKGIADVDVGKSAPQLSKDNPLGI